MSLQEPDSNQSNLELFYTRLSPSPHPSDQESSHAPIVFLHGLESCHIEFSRVTPFLSKDYELILVDLPGHSGSKDALAFSMDNAINALSHLISTKAAGGKAHIVGMSLGGFVGLELARRKPELVLSLFCTGCAPFVGYRRWFISRPRLLGGIEIVLAKFVTDTIFWYSLGLKPLPGLREEFHKNQSMALLTAGYTACTEVSLEKLAEIRSVRIAIIAGGKGDSVDGTRAAGRVLKSKNSDCRAFVVRDAVHLWDLQFPELFANGIRAWIHGNDMPKEFEMLV